ncbi:MAG: hypothetical protein COB13_000265 [OCS116 cluster bacterium]|nr:hypothetical protein [OCS116 cluster bacterium]
MIVFKLIDDEDLLLKCSPLTRACKLTLDYIAENGGIGLTKKHKAFNRTFIHWAANNFDWPEYTRNELFTVNKVLNEIDFPACGIIHTLLLHLKLGRHYKGQFLLTQKGKKLVDAPAAIFEMLAPAYLFDMDHSNGYRLAEALAGTWDIFFNILNVELQTEKSGIELRGVFFGKKEDTESIWDKELSELYHHIIKPLCCAGLVQEFHSSQKKYCKVEDRLFLKTALWPKALKLDTDGFGLKTHLH